MILTPEQFNKLVARDEFNELKMEVREIKFILNSKFDSAFTALDGLAKNIKDIKEEFVSNIAAHDRFENRLIRIEKHLKLDSLF